jgi:ubiquinol-cytochrome c reductase cytochrome b subunit
MVTPAHIVPEWYFLFAYAILRAIPDKLLGVLALGGAIVILAVLPFITASTVQSSVFRPIYKTMIWLFAVDWLLLTWLGGAPVEEPYVILAQVASVFYFAFFVVVLPVLSRLEYWLIPVPAEETA